MANKNLFRATAVSLTTISELMENREKLNIDDVIAMFPNGFHISDFDLINIPETAPFAIITIAENDEVFIFCGVVITNIVNSWVKMFDGDIDECRRVYKEANDFLKVKAEKVRTKNGHTITKVSVIE